MGTDMLYSSGTTGRPKGVRVPLSEEPFGTPSPIMMRLAGLYRIDADTVYLSPAPLYHAAPLRFCMSVLALGGTVVVMERFDPEQALALIERYEATHSQWVPTMFVRMLKLPETLRGAYDLSSHKVAIHAAAPCPVPVKEQLIDWWGPIVWEYYAGTEGNGCDDHRQRAMARAQGIGRSSRYRPTPYLRRRRGGIARRRNGHHPFQRRQ